MSDLIRREDVIREFVKNCSIEHVDINNVAIFYETIMKIINSIPSAEPEQRAKVKEDIGLYCGNCNQWLKLGWGWCPKCGAKLDWSDDE